MLDINKDKEFNLIKIFGAKKLESWDKKYPILKNKDVLNWIRDMIDQYTDEGKEAQKFTITAYLNKLQQYCKYNKVNNPSELLKETDIDERNLRVKKYLQYLLKYDKKDITELKELGFTKIPTSVTIRNNIQAKIKSFYSNRGLSISYNLKSAKTGANKDEITLTKDIIKKIQSKLESPNYRLICKFETQTGLRISDVIEELTSGKYKIELYQEHYFVRNFVSQKEVVTINYLIFTKELTELIQSTYVIDDLTELDLSKLFLTRKGTRINKNDYLERLKAIIKELGIKGNIKTHGLRKYYNSQLSKNRKELDDDRILTHWEGREALYTDQIYSRHIKDLDFYYTEWKKMETFICIDCIVYDNTHKDTKRHNKEILDLKEQNIELTKQVKMVLNEKIELKKKVDKLEEITSKVPNLLEDFENMKNELYNLRMYEEENELINKIIKSTGKSYKEAKKTVLQYRLSKKDISDKDIIESLGLKESDDKPTKKLDVKLSK